MISIILSLILAPVSHGFPQLTRHNYFNCNACHVSPSGGGDLTEYGHGLSGELLSMKAKENESKPFWGAFPDSSTITPSGFVRVLQLYTDNELAREAKAILMQMDLGVTVKHKSFTAVGSVGRRRVAPTGSAVEHEIFSRVHYLMYSSDGGINVRAGKFLPGYGLNHPNHNLFVRRDTGLSNDTERYNAESSYLGDGFSVLGTAIFGASFDHHGKSKEKGGTISVNKSLSESSRLGASFYKGENAPTTRELMGLYGVISYTPSIFSQFEFDRQKITSTAPDKKGLIFSHQLSWEITQGITPYIETQWENLDTSKSITSTGYGLGANFYPRPHFELTGFVGKETSTKLPSTFVTYLMANLYL